jgi:hypothetical protein
MRSTVAKRWTLCGVVASAVIISATASLSVMTGGCGTQITWACDPRSDAGADDGGEGGGDAESPEPVVCDPSK